MADFSGLDREYDTRKHRTTLDVSSMDTPKMRFTFRTERYCIWENKTSQYAKTEDTAEPTRNRLISFRGSLTHSSGMSFSSGYPGC